MELMTDLNDRVVANVSVAVDVDSSNNSAQLNSVLLVYALADFTSIINKDNNNLRLLHEYNSLVF